MDNKLTQAEKLMIDFGARLRGIFDDKHDAIRASDGYSSIVPHGERWAVLTTPPNTTWLMEMIEIVFSNVKATTLEGACAMDDVRRWCRRTKRGL